MEEADDDPAYIAQALGTIARSVNVSELARRVGMSREGLYKALSADGNPSCATIIKVEGTRPQAPSRAGGLTHETPLHPLATARAEGGKGATGAAGGPPDSEVLAAAGYQGRRLAAIADLITSGQRAQRVAA